MVMKCCCFIESFLEGLIISQFPYLQTVFSIELDYFEQGWWMALFGPFARGLTASSLHMLFEEMEIGVVFVLFLTFFTTAFLFLVFNSSSSEKGWKHACFFYGFFWGTIGHMFVAFPD